jgi:hypothetical protein
VVRIRDPGSGKKIIPDPWGKKAPDPGSGSATLQQIMKKLQHFWSKLLDTVAFYSLGRIRVRFFSEVGSGCGHNGSDLGSAKRPNIQLLNADKKTVVPCRIKPWYRYVKLTDKYMPHRYINLKFSSVKTV